ncbi:MAG: hypothetical protein ACK481_08005 [Candidatus Melainabacteria bacterium]
MTITANDLQQTLTKEITKSGVIDLKPRLDAKSDNLSDNEKIAVHALKEVVNSSGDRFYKLDSSEVNDFVLALNNIDGDPENLSTSITDTNSAKQREAFALRALFADTSNSEATDSFMTWTDKTEAPNLELNNKFLPEQTNQILISIQNGLNTLNLWISGKGGPGSFALKNLGPEAANTYADRLARGDYQAWIDMYTNSKSGGRSKTIDPKANISGAGSTSKNIGAFAMAHLVKLPNTVNGFQDMLEKALPQGNPILSIFAGANRNFTINLSNIGTSLSSINGVSQRLNELQVEYSDPNERKNKFAAILAKSTIGVENPSKSERKFNLKLKTDVLLDELFPNLDKDEIKKALKLEGSIMLKDMELTQPSFDTQSTKASDSSTYGVLNKVFNNKETNKNNPNYKEPKEKTGISFTTMNPLTTISLNV